MAFQAFRVRRKFGWNGWIYIPEPDRPCDCGCPDCTDGRASGCIVCAVGCHCICEEKPKTCAGDIWIVEESHPRLEAMLSSRFAIYDSSIPPVEDLLKLQEYKSHLKQPPGVRRQQQAVGV